MNYSLTTDAYSIDQALAERKKSFLIIVEEMKNFQPLPASHFESQWELKREMNSFLSDDHWKKMVKKQVDFAVDPTRQFINQFSFRLSAEYIQIVLLSHSLCEATINAILTVGLANKDMEDMIDKVERFNLIEKWSACPKLLDSSYSMPKDKNPYQTLKELCEIRNSYAHPKVDFKSADNKKIVAKRKEAKRQTFDKLTKQINDFLKLPYELNMFAINNLKGVHFSLLTSPK